MSSLKPTVVGLGVSMPLLAAVAVALRLEARRIKRVRLGADDYTIIAALVSPFNSIYNTYQTPTFADPAPDIRNCTLCVHAGWYGLFSLRPLRLL